LDTNFKDVKDKYPKESHEVELDRSMVVRRKVMLK